MTDILKTAEEVLAVWDKQETDGLPRQVPNSVILARAVLDYDKKLREADAEERAEAAETKLASVKTPEQYQHYKGGVYEVLHQGAYLEWDLRRCVIYRHTETGKTWVRPFEEFHGCVDATSSKKRFTLIPDDALLDADERDPPSTGSEP